MLVKLVVVMLQDDDEPDSGTMIHASANEKTLVPSQVDDGTMIGSRTIEGTMIEHNTGTLVPHGRGGHIADDGYLTDNLGTMVINSDEEEDADSTMKRKYPHCNCYSYQSRLLCSES